MQDIIENGQIYGVSATDVQKILNLKHAWEFILDRDVIQSESNYHMLCHIAKLVNQGFFYDGGRIRGIPVQIGGTSYVPPLPIETVVIQRIDEIRNQENINLQGNKEGDVEPQPPYCQPKREILEVLSVQKLPPKEIWANKKSNLIFLSVKVSA